MIYRVATAAANAQYLNYRLLARDFHQFKHIVSPDT
jgi:hypothetical protein